MKLGEKILELRKKNGLSQEQLGEKLEVTRQTISNWELGETSPNPEQLVFLSKTFNISIDDLLNNDVKNVIVEKVSNTEKLAGLTIKILKWVGIAFLVFLVIDVISLIVFLTIRSSSVQETTAKTICKITKYILLRLLAVAKLFWVWNLFAG
jgi:transcriptional regulator with XRE-family HTH domain